MREEGKGKQSLYRPGQVLRIPGGWASEIWRQSTHECGNVGSPTHLPSLLPPRKYLWYLFLLETEPTPGSWCGRKDCVNEKFQRHHRESNPRPIAKCCENWRTGCCWKYLNLKAMKTVLLIFLLLLLCFRYPRRKSFSLVYTYLLPFVSCTIWQKTVITAYWGITMCYDSCENEYQMVTNWGRVVEMEDMYRIVVNKFEGKRPCGRHILLGDNINP